MGFAATMIRPRYFPDSIVAQLVSVSAFLHSLGHLRTCSGGKSLVCFYQESGRNRSRDSGCTERNCFPYTQTANRQTAGTLGQIFGFQGVFRIPEQHENILGAMRLGFSDHRLKGYWPKDLRHPLMAAPGYER